MDFGTLLPSYHDVSLYVGEALSWLLQIKFSKIYLELSFIIYTDSLMGKIKYKAAIKPSSSTYETRKIMD